MNYINEKYDTSMEGLEIPLLNNNINNGSLMLTELLDIENNNNKESLNNTNNNTNNRTLNITDNNNNNNNSSFLVFKNKVLSTFPLEKPLSKRYPKDISLIFHISKSLFQSIENPFQFKNMIWKMWIYKTKGLFNINIFFDKTI